MSFSAFPRDDFLLLTRLPTAAAGNSLSPQKAPASNPPGAGAALSCQRPFCDDPATDGALCERHVELMKDIRAEYEQLQAEFQDGLD